MKRKRYKKSRISTLLDPWIDRVRTSSDHFMFSLRSRRPSLIDEAARWYMNSARDLQAFVRELVRAIRRARYRHNPLRPRDLSETIFSFKRMRDEAERAIVRHQKLTHGGSRRGVRAARVAAARLVQATRNFANLLKEQLQDAGMWSQAMARTLGMDTWL